MPDKNIPIAKGNPKLLSLTLFFLLYIIINIKVITKEIRKNIEKLVNPKNKQLTVNNFMSPPPIFPFVFIAIISNIIKTDKLGIILEKNKGFEIEIISTNKDISSGIS